MKRVLTVSLIAAVAVTTAANAGWRDMFGLNKSTEPTTLAEACNTDEITSICPEMIMGSKTMMECLSENISSLSSKCAGYVKKQITNKVDEVANTVDATKTEAANTVEAAKADAAAIKADGETVANDVNAAAKQTGEDVKETGGWFRNLFK
ncbi:MAG: hypothetical protein IJQ90_01545 [Alphaproteobacteria bacterium]|nr:hypothetical protein [Alphaproteobacteria bacterium]